MAVTPLCCHLPAYGSRLPPRQTSLGPYATASPFVACEKFHKRLISRWMGQEPGSGGPDKGLAQGQKYFAVGLRFAGGVVAFTLGGYALDRWLETVPLFTLIGTVGGSVLSFVSVYRQLILESRDASRENRDQS